MRWLLALLVALPLSAESTVTLLHFSDYHSHALPFYTDEGELGGIARAVGYLRQQKREGALVFSGGDMINKGAPAWSDRYQCAEWPWLNGIVSAMAFGNHEPDYGRDAFERCRKQLDYPILSANTPGFEPYVVLKTRGVRVGVFAVAGPDFPKLVKGYTFSDSVSAARAAVAALRPKSDVVLMIGHESMEDDYALARAVPGIDLIFGTHSHLKQHLVQIPGTTTSFLSPWQYLTYISRVEVTVSDDRVKSVRGRLVPVNASMPADRRTEKHVAQMQRELERAQPELFAPAGTLASALSTEQVAQRTLAAMREAVRADVAISTKSSFRGPLPAGTITLETLRSALPYDNELVVCTMSDAQLRGLLGESYVTEFERKSEYRVATTDYLAYVAHQFTCDRTGLRVREELRKRL
ncbi:MAG TPA: 5'-nucleotidase C-terminal domain-containing protein [Thermoanaerobaculia bacterium]|nr:5'-nucleotidase C-terminal domain-containing protein [Thermoanaerobaculia bacterium]